MLHKNLEKFDICMIGASIAGNYLSYLLSKTNLKIAIIEEHEKIGYPFQCAGIVSKKLKKFISVPEKIILNRVRVAKLISPNGNILKLSGDEEPYIIDRIKLDQLFFEKIKDKPNIEYFLGERFKSFEYVQSSQDLIVKTSERKIKSKILVGCDGPLSSVAHQLGIQNQIIYATQIRIKSDFNENEAVLYFDEAWNELFGWIVPEGNQIYRIGLASSNRLSQKFQSYLKNLNIKYSRRIDQQGGLIPIGLMNTLAFDNALLLGDAACQVKATTGGGIIMLLTAAKYAAKCIFRCFQDQDFSQKFIEKHYQEPCESAIGGQLKIHYLIRLLLQKCSNHDIEQLFKIISREDIKEQISLYGDMDFPKKLLIKLIFNPSIIKFLLQILIRNPEIILKLFRIYF